MVVGAEHKKVVVMRTLAKNKQKMYYALLNGKKPVYEFDDDGNAIVDYVDEEGNVYYRETGSYEPAYDKPVEFLGNIAMSGGESEAVEYGLNLGDYEAVLIVPKNLLPITEISLIWHNTEPKYNADETVDGHSADYSVIKISHSLNVDKYVLKKVVK